MAVEELNKYEVSITIFDKSWNNQRPDLFHEKLAKDKEILGGGRIVKTDSFYFSGAILFYRI
ncbi:hypothetical protein FC093_10805 [Ilyomonas limi]|uniref:Uncharacterized protein n=1 Tax=Ilyomonas limi TaxID=2575867 RepID=A0A4U3L1E8_9BACT|nr:hypothetical protein [Ilyomonas limi]TKK68602.1 hypothetical protein FC093_10805 [Ilyomonas limi]